MSWLNVSTHEQFALVFLLLKIKLRPYNYLIVKESKLQRCDFDRLRRHVVDSIPYVSRTVALWCKAAPASGLALIW